MGGSRAEDIDYVVFVDSRAYYEFPYKRKPDIAHIIGDINHHFRKSNQNLLLFVLDGSELPHRNAGFL